MSAEKYWKSRRLVLKMKTCYCLLERIKCSIRTSMRGRAPGVLITAIKDFKMELELGINIIFLEGKPGSCCCCCCRCCSCSSFSSSYTHLKWRLRKAAVVRLESQCPWSAWHGGCRRVINSWPEIVYLQHGSGMVLGIIRKNLHPVSL